MFLHVPEGQDAFVQFRFVSWPRDSINRQEHRETLNGSTIIIGRKAAESKALSCFPGATYFCPRDVTVERFLSSRFPQVGIHLHGDAEGASRWKITALQDPKHPERKIVNGLMKRSSVSPGSFHESLSA